MSEQKITRETVLKEAQAMAWHNVFCYSATCCMDSAKPGFEEQWQEANAKAEIVDAMLLEETTGKGGKEDPTAAALRTRMAELAAEAQDAAENLEKEKRAAKAEIGEHGVGMNGASLEAWQCRIFDAKERLEAATHEIGILQRVQRIAKGGKV